MFLALGHKFHAAFLQDCNDLGEHCTAHVSVPQLGGDGDSAADLNAVDRAGCHLGGLGKLVQGYVGECAGGGEQATIDNTHTASSCNKEEILSLQRLCRDVPISEDLKMAAVGLVMASRSWEGVQYGASPRASIGLILSSKARAFLLGRNHVSREDLHAMAYPVLRHRLILDFEAERKGLTPDQVITQMLKQKNL